MTNTKNIPILVWIPFRLLLSNTELCCCLFFFKQVLPVVTTENLLISCVFDRNTKQEIAVVCRCKKPGCSIAFVSDVDDKVYLLNLERTSREECKYV